MSEAEKYEQVGRLAEEYSHAKGKLAHILERLERARADYTIASNQPFFTQLKVIDGKLVTPHQQIPSHRAGTQLEGLLSHHELTEVIAEKQNLEEETQRLARRLKELAPHLLP